MILGGAMRISEYDLETKGLGEVFDFCLRDMASKVDDVFIFASGLRSSDLEPFVRGMKNLRSIYCSFEDQGTGWGYNNIATLQGCVRAVTRPVDWLVFPDSDETMPAQTRNICWGAELAGRGGVFFHILDLFGSRSRVAEPEASQIGHHCLAAKFSKELSFDKSSGFNKPSSLPDVSASYLIADWPAYHYRYSSRELWKKRREAKYYQDFPEDVATVALNAEWTYEEYRRAFSRRIDIETVNIARAA